MLPFDSVRRASLVLGVAGLFSCTFDIPDVVPRDGGALRDTSAVADAASDGTGPTDGTTDGTTDGPVGTVYNDMTLAANWKIFDTAGVTGGGSVQTYTGGTFDGRYVYLAPAAGAPASSVVLQLDTTAAKGFTDPSSWAHFDTMANVSSAAGGFCGAAYDGNQFVYLTPLTTAASATSAADGFLTRYDSRSPYSMAGSWSGFNATGVNMGAQGFAGEAFDGQYIYFAPNFAGSSAASGLVARFDTKAGFAGGSSAWAFFDALNFDALAAGFIGAVFDGRYVTFVPSATTVALQYDTHGSFIDNASWSSLNLELIPKGSTQIAFAGGIYDGQYVYLVPEFYYNGTSYIFGSLVARYDPKLGFGAGAWTTFDVSTVSPYARGFAGGAFDGRYVYLVPEGNTGTPASTGQFMSDGFIVRYDTSQPFGNAGSWSTFDVKAAFGTTVAGFFGAVFDGRYLYLVPEGNTTVARFDARTPAAMPALPAFHGSFF